MDSNVASEPLNTTILEVVDGWAARTPSGIAAEFEGQKITYAELRSASLHVSRALLSAGVQPCDRVPLLTDMSLDMIPAVMGILRVGACFAPMDVAAWSRPRIEAALSKLAAPTALVTSYCPGLQLPVVTVNFQKQWLRQPLEDADGLFAKLDAIRSGLRTDHLAWIIFTSGTTGKPKGVMVYHKGIQALVPEFLDYDNLKADVEARGVRCLLAASVAFDGCQATVWGTLRRGRTLVMASPSNFHEVAATCEVWTLTPSMLAALDPAGPYDRVHIIFIGAEAPSREVYQHWIRPQRRVINTYGPSETTCIISMGDLSPEGEPTFGELMSSVKVVLVDADLQEANVGEVMISGPGLAAGYLNNDELTATKFIQWKGQRFYRTGDLARRRKDGQLVFMGRADSLVKNRGFLINLETEVEPALLSFDPVRVAVAFKAQNGRLTGCVQPATVDVDQLRQFLRGRCDPFVIPDDLVALDSFPLNVNGKTDRNALKVQPEFSATQQDEDDPDDDDRYQNGYDALCAGFAQILHVPFKQLDRDSSFTALGGHSLAAIRLSNFLKQHGHSLLAVQMLRLDSIKRLEEAINQNKTHKKASKDKLPDGPAPATDVQKLLIRRSLQDPKICALIGVATHIGDAQAMPTASELHDAIVTAGSAHQIFQTRFDLSDLTLHDLGRLNLDWREVSVPRVAEFEAACAACEEQAWHELRETTPADVEVPYCQITCVSVPHRKAVALVTRMHHILTDVFSAALFWRDVERALAGEQVPRGPQIQNFARFMHAYKRENLDRARMTFEKMLGDLPATAVLQPPSPSTPQHTQQMQLGLVRLNSPATVAKAALDGAARNHRVTATTLVYAAWSLFLSSITAWDRVGFSVSLSGRTVPWPEAQLVLGSLVNRAIFSTHVAPKATVREWLADVHKTTLDLVEFDGLTHGLPESLMADPRTNTTNVLCFLDVPQSSSNWNYRDQQGHNYLIDWYIFPDGNGGVKTEFEVQAQRVDLDWAKAVAGVPGRLLDQLAHATPEILVGHLLR
ncbi:putative nonribosomal peptide synthase [Trematosphaeria pertusa]|uniref:Putative nonribosomal peptide synthase n=1 Tax=Trematosphaeria pertusa TaxID=390896 RepID=A0A6A6HSK5_9PLEO|nr:putative nonribosomal peptide synthase [Trematosphaeria pertusa]KAF2241164.1 putative nonribosomal peptide synthase [Trematosphaeria pertusa]